MTRGGGALANSNKNNTKRESKWSVPDELVQFMSNVPKSIVAVCPKSLLWTVKRVLTIISDKTKADNCDDLLGIYLCIYFSILLSNHLLISCLCRLSNSDIIGFLY
jgi:hypothetical protein